MTLTATVTSANSQSDSGATVAFSQTTKRRSRHLDTGVIIAGCSASPSNR